MANWIIFHLYFNEKRHHILGQNFGILTIVCYGPLRSKMFCLLLCELQVRTRQSRCIEVVHPYFQFMISCLWFLRIIWDSFWISKRKKGVKFWLQNNLAHTLGTVELAMADNRDHPRFFDQFGHQTTDASIGNKYFFTK